MLSYAMTSKAWFEAGIKAASPTNTNKVRANEVVAYPKITLQEVQNIWKSSGNDFTVDPRVHSSVETEAKYVTYSEQQNKEAANIAQQHSNTDISGILTSPETMQHLKS